MSRILSFLSLMVISYLVEANTVIKFCNDSAEWPPYIFLNRTPPSNEYKPKLVGATIDLLNIISEKKNFKFTASLVPWKRCLQLVKNHEPNYNFDIISEGFYSDERAKHYIYSKPIYNTSPGFFYSKEKNFFGKNLNKTTDLNKYKLCGNSGYSYKTFFE